MNGIFVTGTECSNANRITLIALRSAVGINVISLDSLNFRSCEWRDVPVFSPPVKRLDDWMRFLELFRLNSPFLIWYFVLNLLWGDDAPSRWVTQNPHDSIWKNVVSAAEQRCGQKQTAEGILIGCILLDCFFQSETAFGENLLPLWFLKLLTSVFCLCSFFLSNFLFRFSSELSGSAVCQGFLRVPPSLTGMYCGRGSISPALQHSCGSEGRINAKNVSVFSEI